VAGRGEGDLITGRANGSGALVRSLLRDNLLDELRLFVHPVVVGSGRRLFEGGDHFDLTLADWHTYENGVISVTYTSAPRPAAE
jgi:dihydrofolate reductase